MSGPAILIAIKGLGIGGAEKLIAESASKWDRTRFDYRVVYALPWKDQLVAPIEALGIPVTCIGTKRGMTPSAWWRLRREAAGADLVHAHLPAMGAVARVFSGRPVVYTEHNVASSYRGPVRWANRLTYRGNDAVTTVSAAVATSIADYPGPDPRVVSNGVSCDVPAGAPDRVRRELAIDGEGASRGARGQHPTPQGPCQPGGRSGAPARHPPRRHRGVDRRREARR